MIEVRFQRRKMGALNISAPKHERCLRVGERNATGDPAKFSERTFSLTSQTSLVNEEDLLRGGVDLDFWIINELGLDPKDCTVLRDPMNMGYRVTRPAIIASDIDEYEFLFDRPEFIPC
ncbi:hypothetical protein EVB77_021 [Rhizobium phage RHph_N1_10]|nr:hypothetical protein EVB77_021 [Rhizobium phage RHph_N1_10]